MASQKQGTAKFLVVHGSFHTGIGDPAREGDVLTLSHADAKAGVGAGTLQELSEKESRRLERKRAFEAKLAEEEAAEEDEDEGDDESEEDEEESEPAPPKASAKSKPASKEEPSEEKKPKDDKPVIPG